MTRDNVNLKATYADYETPIYSLTEWNHSIAIIFP
jgi:hypothetical protein